MPSYHSIDSLGRRQSSTLDASGTSNPFLEGSLGSGQSVQSEMLPQQEASFRELPGDNNWPSAAAAAPAYSEGRRRSEDHHRDSAAESGSEAHIMMHSSQPGQQHASDSLDLSGQQQVSQETLHGHQQPPRQLQQQLSGNPFLSSTPSPFASSSGEPMAEPPFVPQGPAGVGARSQASQAEDHVRPEWQQAGRGNSDAGMRHAGSGLQPLPPGALSSTPSLAEMLSDLRPAGDVICMTLVMYNWSEAISCALLQLHFSPVHPIGLQLCSHSNAFKHTDFTLPVFLSLVLTICMLLWEAALTSCGRTHAFSVPPGTIAHYHNMFMASVVAATLFWSSDAPLCVLNGQTTPCRVKGASPKRQPIHG